MEADRGGEPRGVVAGHGEGVGREVASLHFGPGAAQGEAHGDAARAGAAVEHARMLPPGGAQGFQNGRAEVHESFGLGTGDEYAGSDAEGPSGKAGRAQNVLHGLESGKALTYIKIALLLFFRKIPNFVGINGRAPHTEGFFEHEEGYGTGLALPIQGGQKGKQTTEVCIHDLAV